ncbi:Glycosyl hydrolase family 67 C-terminus [Paraoerskovia marina]|uniref:Glycosyl hydrolase family 67 C-terminus n=1 Tax=Paraoerskovia marina TaxID=545619 RepID=A0A1H1VZH6_9CELL|nr:Glycosyl hydrolase family 67 C-terminus [Paraoerskovia marina]
MTQVTYDVPVTDDASRRTRRRPWTAAIAAVVLLALGLATAVQLSGFLGIETTEVSPAPEDPQAAPVTAAVPAPAVERVEIPDDKHVRTAADTLLTVLGARGVTATTQTSTPSADAEPDAGTLLVTIETPIEDLATGTPDTSGSTEAYRLTTVGDGWLLESADATGAARGIYDLADRVRTGADPVPADIDGTVQTPTLDMRLVSLGATGVVPDAETWMEGDPYSHNAGGFSDAVLADPPYVDTEALAVHADELDTYLKRRLAQGYTGFVAGGFLEYLTFSGVEDGAAVYGPDDEHVARAEAMQATFGQMWQDADEIGMDVYLATDMLVLTTPLQEYLDENGWDTSDPEFWDVYSAGLDELFTSMPAIDGVMVRIGEAGSIYDQDGWDYWSELAVTDEESVRAMLTAFTDVAEEHGKDVIFRSWSVGVGAVGDMHTNPESYSAVLDGLDSPALVVSTKHVAGDFYSWLPLNPTLEIGDQRRIVEMQSRREFEGFGALPNDLGSAYAEAMQHYLETNPNVEGVWAWPQSGGPTKAGPMIFDGKTGFWELYELNTYASARVAADPTVAPGEITAAWAYSTFSEDPQTVAAIGEAMAMSRDAITDGLYIGPFAQYQTKALGLEPPPMMWIFEWDILSGDAAALDSISSVVGDDLDEALAEGHQAVATSEEMRDLVAGTDPATWRDAELRDEFLAALDYQVDLFTVLADYRDVFLQHGRWLDTADADARAAWAQARDAYEVSRAHHVETYGENVYLPAYTFDAADLGVERAERDHAVAWVARVLGLLLVLTLALGTSRGQRLLARTGLPGGVGLRALWIGATRPWRVHELAVDAGRTDRVLVWAVPAAALVLSRVAYTWALSWVHLALVLGAWALFVGVLWASLRGRDAFALAGAVGGAAVLRTVMLMVALVPTGPGGYWYGLWAEPVARTVYVTVAVAAFCWVLLAAAWAMRGLGIGRAGAVGRVLLAVAAPLVVGGVAVGAVGLETTLTAWNDQMMILPWGLSRILGLTVHLGIPVGLPWTVATLGAVLAGAGALLWAAGVLVSRRRRRI